MVDTYYDNATFDAAKHDVAIRYRWTEGNQAGAWNFKPGLAVVDADGLKACLCGWETDPTYSPGACGPACEGSEYDWTIEQIHELTNIDPWFLAQMKELVEFETELATTELTGLLR